MSKVTPVNWSPFIQEALVTTNNIFSQGFVEIDTSSIITNGGKYFVRPYQDNLDTIDNPQKIIASTTLTPTTLSDFQENLVVCHVGDSYYETEYDRITRGSSGLDAAMVQRGEIVLKMLQNYMINVIRGVFATELATSHTYDATGDGSGVFGTYAATKAAQTKFDEQMDIFDGYIMNSVTFGELLIAGSAAYEFASDFSNTIMQTGKIPTFLGKKVFINDTLCAVNGDGNYPVYMMSGKPLYLAWQKNVSVYEKFEPATGHGRYEVYWYADFVPAVKGLSWTAGTYDPAVADLATGTNWTKVFENKHIKMLKVIVKPA
jgi:hypothetical protein